MLQLWLATSTAEPELEPVSRWTFLERTGSPCVSAGRHAYALFDADALHPVQRSQAGAGLFASSERVEVRAEPSTRSGCALLERTCRRSRARWPS